MSVSIAILQVFFNEITWYYFFCIIIIVIIMWTTEKVDKKSGLDVSVFKVSDWCQWVEFMQNLEHDIMLFSHSETIISVLLFYVRCF